MNAAALSLSTAAGNFDALNLIRQFLFDDSMQGFPIDKNVKCCVVGIFFHSPAIRTEKHSDDDTHVDTEYNVIAFQSSRLR